MFESRYKRSLQTHLLNPQGLNSYAYANNNPLKYSDPDGEIIPVVVAAWVIAEVGMSAYDIYDTVTTLASDASFTDKSMVTGGLLMGVVLPGGGYGTAGKQIAKHADEVVGAGSKVLNNANNALDKTQDLFSRTAKHSQKHYPNLSANEIGNLGEQTMKNADIKVTVKDVKKYYYNTKTNDLFINNPKSPTMFQPDRGKSYLRDAVRNDLAEGGWLK